MVTPNYLLLIPKKKQYLLHCMSSTKSRDKKALKTCLALQVTVVIQLIQVIPKMMTPVRNQSKSHRETHEPSISR